MTCDHCHRPARAKNLCTVHYQRARKGLPMDAPVRTIVKGATPEERLLAGLPDRPAGECWLWARSASRMGYGKVWCDGRLVAAHRLAYETWVGPIPEGASLLHTCDTPACCNPAHLRPGSRRENSADMTAKGRQQRGERSGHARLTEAEVLEIRADERSLAAIARAYEVSYGCVSAIKHRRSWAHI